MIDETRAQHGERTDSQFNWLFQGLNSASGSGEITKYLEQFVASDHELLTNQLVSAIRRGRCPAQSKPQFVRWCKRQIDEHADSLIPHFLAKRIKESNGRLTVSDVMHIAALHGKQRKGTACFPRMILNGNVALVDTGKNILKVPAKADSDDPVENFLPILELLWPWNDHEGQIQKYSSRKSYSTGQLIPCRISLHRLFVAFCYGNWSDEAVQARDGDFLNWTNRNLYRESEEHVGSDFEKYDSDRLRQLFTGREGEDLLPLSSASIADPMTGEPVSCIPAQAVRPKGHGPNTGLKGWSSLYRRKKFARIGASPH
jgi:hypothetical protein